MYCKHCYKLINEANPVVCPYCGKSVQEKKKVPFYKKLWFWLLVGAFVVIGGIGGSGTPELVSSTSSAGQQQPAPQTVIDTPHFFAVGETARLNDVYVRLDSAYESHGEEFFEPDPGMVYLICEFTIENNSASELNVSSMLCFNAYVDDYAVNPDIFAESFTNVSSLDGTIASGKKMKGAIGYQVDQNWKELEIHFNPDVWSTSEDFIFVVTN